MALWGNNDNLNSAGTVVLDYSTGAVTGTGTTFGAAGAGHTEAQVGDIIRFGEPSEIAPFWVGILKGSKYPGSAGQGLVHRSPPIAESGQTRVVFCLDC